MDVSVITCVYNQLPTFFQECAESLCAQMGAVEWIVVDDGSDKSAKVEHSRVVSSLPANIKTLFIGLEKNVGLSAARNVALRHTRGRWIIVLDSDDRLAPDITTVLATLPASISLACFEVTYRDGTTVEHRTLKHFQSLFMRYAGTSLDPFLWYDFYYHGIIARRELLQTINGYNEKLRVGEDQDILLRALEVLSPEQVRFIHKIGYEYHCRSTGVCKTRWPEVLENYTTSMVAGAVRRGAVFKNCRLGGTEIINGSVIDSYEYEDQRSVWHNFHQWAAYSCFDK